MTQEEVLQRARKYADESGLPYTVWHRNTDGAWCIKQGPVTEPPQQLGVWVAINHMMSFDIPTEG